MHPRSTSAIRTLSALCLLGGALVPHAFAQQAGSQPADLQSGIDRIFAPMSGPGQPGCATAVMRDGVLVFERGYGVANLETDTPISARSIFHVASVSKQFTAFAVMLLADEGRLSLDDDVRRYVHELPDHGRAITIRQMLQHVSGLRDQWALLMLARGRFEEDRITEADVLDIISRQRALNFAPGAEYLYSNTGYTLAAVIVNRVTGQTLRDFAAERIFAPLGMESTHFHDDYTRVVPGRTSAYAPRPEGGWRVSIPNYDTYGATSLFTTVGDLMKWQANMENPRVGNSSIFRRMEEVGVLASGAPTSYGLGLMVDRYRGHPVIGHSGSDAGYRAYLGRFPEQRLSVAVLCNHATANATLLARQVADLLLPPTTVAGAAGGAAAAPSPSPASTRPRAPAYTTAAMGAYAGTYYSEELDALYRVAVVDGRLHLRTRTSRPRVVAVEGVDTFAGEGLTVRFTRGAAGEVDGFTLDAGRVRGLHFVRRVE